MWLPTSSDIKECFMYLQQVYPQLQDHKLMKESAIKSIVDKVQHGLPFKEITFYDRMAILLFDLITEHCYSDGNKRIAFLSVIYTLSKNNYILMGTDEYLITFVMNVAKGLLFPNQISDEMRSLIKERYMEDSIPSSLIHIYDKVFIALGE